MPGTTSTALPSFSDDQHHETDAATHMQICTYRKANSPVASSVHMHNLCTKHYRHWNTGLKTRWTLDNDSCWTEQEKLRQVLFTFVTVSYCCLYLLMWYMYNLFRCGRLSATRWTPRVTASLVSSAGPNGKVWRLDTKPWPDTTRSPEMDEKDGSYST